MEIEDLVLKNLDIAGDFTDLSPKQTKAYQKRLDGIITELERIKADKAKGGKNLGDLRRQLIAVVNTDPAVYKKHETWAKFARIANRDDIHHRTPLSKFQTATIDYRPNQLVDFHSYLADREIYLANHPKNARSFHEVTHVGSKQQPDPTKQGSPGQSAHPRGTKDGSRFEFEYKTPHERAEELAELNKIFSEDVENVLKPGGLEDTRRGLMGDKLIKEVRKRKPLLADAMAQLRKEGTDILDAGILKKLGLKGDMATWLGDPADVNAAAGKQFGLKIRSFDPISTALEGAYKAWKQNPVGTTLGTFYGLAIDPDLREAKTVGEAATVIGRDATIGYVAEGAGKFGLNIANRVAPQTMATIGSRVAPVAAGVSPTLGALGPATFVATTLTGSSNRDPEAAAQNLGYKNKEHHASEVEKYEARTGLSGTTGKPLYTGLSQEESRLYKAGGGNAAMTKHGWTMEETMNIGKKNELVQAYIYMPDKT
jgi:hypothetical protein